MQSESRQGGVDGDGQECHCIVSDVGHFSLAFLAIIGTLFNSILNAQSKHKSSSARLSLIMRSMMVAWIFCVVYMDEILRRFCLCESRIWN